MKLKKAGFEMDILHYLLGLVAILLICAILHRLACYVGSKARFYERFMQVLKKVRNRKNDEQL